MLALISIRVNNCFYDGCAIHPLVELRFRGANIPPHTANAARGEENKNNTTEMGSKPSFPTDTQWHQWKTETNSEIVQKMETLTAQSNVKLDQDMAKAMNLFGDYMYKCHDRSIFKKLVFDGDECAMARQQFLEHVANSMVSRSYAVDVISEIEKLKQ